MATLVVMMIVLMVASFPLLTETKCSKGCDLALASYYIWEGSNLTYIATMLSSSIVQPNNTAFNYILGFNPGVSNKDSVTAGSRINIPFPCECLNGEFLGHVFQYAVKSGDTYLRISSRNYSNLTNATWLENFNSYPATNIPSTATLNVTVTCSCGNAAVSKDYGLFITYPLRPEDTLASVSKALNISEPMLQSFNLGVDFSKGSGLIFVPGKDNYHSYRPLALSSGLGAGAIAGICVAAIVVALLVAVFLYARVYRRKSEKDSLIPKSSDLGRGTDINSQLGNDASVQNLAGITVEKSVEFPYEELAMATDDFSLARKIGEGGFGSVYYAELRGEKAAIKKMDMQATKEFFSELKVLTHVHHLNLVRLIGYCAEGSLFLVYEYMEKGNLLQHLRGADGMAPLPWSTRVKIALDSARGLEYIHEHTVPVYIHRDIKSANILIDANFRGKVADFGLTKLSKVTNASLLSGVVGTFGYMAPEYAQYGDVSPKLDVYAFGVVLYELISAKNAIIKSNDSALESRGLVGLFEDAFGEADPKEGIRRLVDPRLGPDFQLDSIYRMAQLARACTDENPHSRPSMRSVVVALMTLSSSTDDWDVGSFFGNHLVSGR